MPRRGISRIVSIFVGAAVLFGLQQGLNLQFYIALPAAILAYVASLVAMGLIVQPRA